MKTILVTAIGGDIAQGVAKIIRETRKDCRIIGVDMHEEHGGRLFADAFYKVPSASNEGYARAVKDIVIQEGVDTIIPMAEPELAVLDALQNEISAVKWITAGADVISVGLDKLTTARELANLGLPVPWTTLVNAGAPKQLPCILKSRTGSGSRAVYIITSDEDVEYYSKRNPDAIYQELLEPADKEITCAVYRTVDGRVATLQMLRRLVGGMTGWAKIIDDEEISQMCEAIANGLNLRGSMNVQLRLTDQGPRVFEINPRFSSTTAMRHLIGFSDVLWSLDEAEGQAVTFPTIQQDLVMVRTQGAAIA